VKRTVRKTDTSGQLSLAIEVDIGGSSEDSKKTSRARAKFIEPEPALTQIGLKDHLNLIGRGDVFIIDRLLREQDWSAFESSYPATGRRAYAPRLMTGLILYGVMHGKTSLRDLESIARDSLGCLWISGGIMPDHSVIGRFICQHASLLSVEFFHGLTSSVLTYTGSNVERTAGDGTVIEAAASRYETIKREALESRIDRGNKRLKESRDDKKADPKKIKRTEKQLEQLHEAEQELSKREAQRRSKGKDPSKIQINPQEPEAVNQPLKQQGYGVSYRPGVIVNDQRVIVGHGVDATSETRVAEELLAQASGFGQLKESSWDAGYSNQVMFEQQEQYDVSLLIPEGRPDSLRKTPYKWYPKSQFSYDATTDTYRCPAGQLLQARGSYKGSANTQPYTRYGTKACQHCDQRNRCTSSKRGRQINRYEHEHLREAMREKLQDESVLKRYQQRAGWVEPIFAHLRLRQELNRFRRKGQAAVGVEFALHVLAFNLSRAVAYTRAQEPLLAILRWLQCLLSDIEESMTYLRRQSAKHEQKSLCSL